MRKWKTKLPKILKHDKSLKNNVGDVKQISEKVKTLERKKDLENKELEKEQENLALMELKQKNSA